MLDRPIEYNTPHLHVETILRTLEARPAGTDRWRARCPAHDGQSRTSLSIRTGDDGRVLVHCFAGCTPGDVLAAAGLTWGDAFGDSKPKPMTATRAAAALTEDVITAHLTRARIVASRSLAHIHKLIRKTSQFIQSSQAHGIETPALASRLGQLVLLRDDLGGVLTDLDSRDPMKPIEALLRLRQRGRNAH